MIKWFPWAGWLVAGIFSFWWNHTRSPENFKVGSVRYAPVRYAPVRYGCNPPEGSPELRLRLRRAKRSFIKTISRSKTGLAKRDRSRVLAYGLKWSREAREAIVLCVSELVHSWCGELFFSNCKTDSYWRSPSEGHREVAITKLTCSFNKNFLGFYLGFPR